MNQLRLFRTLIGAQIAITVLAIGASVRLEKTLPETLQAYLRAQQDAPFDTKEVFVATSAMILLAAGVVAWIGLLRFWRIGPWFYLAATIGGTVLTLAAGPTVASAIETTLNAANSIIGGAILAMAFLSDVAPRFRGVS